MLLASHMLQLSGIAGGDQDARGMLTSALNSGAALGKLREMVIAQGGDASYIDAQKVEELCSVKRQIPVILPGNGRIQHMDAYKIGVAAQVLGAGRAKKEDTVDHAVGLVMHKRLGDLVEENEPVCTLYVNDEAHVNSATALLQEAVSLQTGTSSMVYAVLK
jgi:pyrimidine-nucleoside phosphorylase